MKKLLLLALTLLYATLVFGQQRTIVRGRVVDKADGQPVIGATVIEYDSEERVVNGTISDVNGDFVLEMKSTDHKVMVSFIGYTIQEVPVGTTGPVMVEMESSAVEMEEVTITAEAKEMNRLTNIEDRDNAASTVKIDFLEMGETGAVSAADALQGKVSGVDIISNSGDPGSGSALVIRGLSSMGNARPLIVIDGIPQQRVSESFDLTSADSEDISQLINIAVQDIKSIEVLKDAASTAVYGSKGADGVLMIETLRGRMGKVQFDYQFRNSINVQPDPIPMLTGDEYIMLQLEEWHNARGVFSVPSEIAYDRDYIDFYNYSANTDWLGAITRNSLTYDNYFKITGGGERTRYFTSFNYVSEGGTTINTYSKRFSTRVNLDYFLTRNLSFSVKFDYTNNNTRRNARLWGARNVRAMAYVKAPNMSIWEYDEFGNPTGDYFTPINSYQGSGTSYFNPVALAELGKDDRLLNQLQNTFQLRYRISPIFQFRTSLSFQYAGTKSNNFIPYNAIGADWLSSAVNRAVEGNSLNTSLRTESQLTFNSPFSNEDHVLTGAVNWITNQSQSEWVSIQGNRSPSSTIQDPAIDPQINWMGNGSSETRELGAMANLNYKFKDRYMVQTVYRTDAHSAFGSSNRWGNFGSVSVGWRFSEESFLAGIPWLGESKLTTSWGVSGRQPGDAYARFATYESTYTGSYINDLSVVPTQVQLNRLQWETIEGLNAAIELNMLQDRFYLKGELYSKITKDILFRDYEIPRSAGFDELRFYNGGELENKGWEIMADYKAIRRATVLWSLNFNISRNVNSFNALPENFNKEQDISIGNGEYPKRIVEGESIGSFFGFRYLGVWPTDEDVVALDENGNVLLDGNGEPVPFTYAGVYEFRGGDAIYQDINHDGMIDLNDVVYIGNSNPDYVGGFGTLIRWRDFDFSANFYYRVGFDIVNRTALETQSMSNRNNQSKAVLKRWRVQGQNEEGMLPRAYLNHPANNLGSDRYIEQGDFIRLNSIRVGYDLDKELCNRLGLRHVNISLVGRKLLTFTRYTGQDPEVPQDAADPFWIGEDRANTPPPRIFTMSILVAF